MKIKRGPKRPQSALSEDHIQRLVCEHLERRGTTKLWFHPANGGSRTISEAVRFKRMGVKPGVPDLIIFREGCYFALELKTLTGRPTENQLAWKDWINEDGGFCAIAYGLDAALRVLETWGILK